MSDGRPRAAVIGAGIAGLVAARDLASDHEVALIESAGRLGGKIDTVVFRGHPLDTGADAFITRNPAAIVLCDELGLRDELIEPSSAGAGIFARGAVHPLPDGLVLGIPTDLVALARSRIIGVRGLFDALRDRIARSLAVSAGLASSTDPTVDEIFAPRFGHEVVDRLIDPLVGGINAGDVAHLSFAAAMPQIAARLGSATSIARRLRPARTSPAALAPSIFRGLRGGMGDLVAALARDLADRGVSVHLGETVGAIERGAGDGFRIVTAKRTVEVEHVVVATPAYVTAALVANLAPTLAATLAEIPYASVATVTMAWPASTVDPSIARRLLALAGQRSPGASPSPSERRLPGSGLLMARDEGLTITAASFTSTKWPRSANADEVVVRASLGRHGDETAPLLDDAPLLDLVRGELARTLKLTTEPLGVHVQRWPQSFPQYTSGHLARIDAIEAAAHASGIVLAGAAYRGIGIPACIDSARAATTALRRRSAGVER